MVIVDKDAGAVDYEEKLHKQERLISVVEAKGGEVIVLRKREIENYYSPHIVKEMLEERGVEIEEFEIGAYDDFPTIMKRRFEGQNVQLKFKNNIEVFERMSLKDWKNVSAYMENGIEHYELAEIAKAIKERIGE